MARYFVRFADGETRWIKGCLLAKLHRQYQIVEPVPHRTPATPPVPQRPYIPEKMPPVDLPGLHFQEPQSDNWRRQHRSVVAE